MLIELKLSVMEMTKKAFDIVKQKGSTAPNPVSITMERQKSVPEIRIIEGTSK